MKKMYYIIILLLINCLLIHSNLEVDDHKNNKYIKKIKIFNDKISDVTIYEKYVVIEKIVNHNIDGFNIYKNENLKKYNNYLKRKKPIYISKKNEPAWFLGIYDNYLFVDYGTGPGIRGLEIYNLENNELLFSGSWYGKNIIFKSEYKVYVYIFNNESGPDEEDPLHKYIYKLHEYLLNLKNKELINTNAIKELVEEVED